MRKFMAILLCLFLMTGLFSACGSTSTADSSDDNDTSAIEANTSTTDSNTAGADGEDSLSIVATIFPEYDWVREILGDAAETTDLTLLIDSGVDLHSFQPTVEDILTISTCDLFIYVGGESDEWVEDALAEAMNADMVVINLLDVLGDSVKEEETVEGMEAEEEEEEEDGEDEVEYDEHVWLSLANAQTICDVITEALAGLDEANEAVYTANNAAYQEKLAALDAEYAAICQSATQTTLLFGDRFPFRYLVDDYGLSYYAAFNGCSAETEASFETIIFLAQKVDELGLSCVLTIETSDGEIARTIVENTTEKDQQILVFNSMQAVTAQDVANGVTYLSLAEENLAVLAEALQ